jgi:hypothetical protein
VEAAISELVSSVSVSLFCGKIGKIADFWSGGNRRPPHSCCKFNRLPPEFAKQRIREVVGFG